MGKYSKYFNEITTTSKYSKYFDKPTAERTTYDISDIDKLKEVAASKGLEVKEKKPSLFRRTIDVISRPLYTSAGIAKAIIKKENIAKEAWKGFTGKEKETYSDVLESAGVKNKWAKGIVGFALDVALDPITYFGGFAIKGAYRGAKAVVKPVAGLAAKAAPESALHVADAARSLKDAFGSAFKFGYKTTGGLADDVSRAINKMGIAKDEVIRSNVKMFGKAPSEEKIRKATELMMNNRLVERGFKKGKILKSTDKETNAMLQSMKAKGQEIAQKAGLKPRKYVSAEEFVKANNTNPTILFRGIKKGYGTEGRMGETWVTSDFDIAQRYAGKDGKVISFPMSDNIKGSWVIEAKTGTRNFQGKIKLIDKGTEITKSELAQTTKGVGKGADEWYFPWMDVEKIGKKGAVGALKVSQQGYLKQFRNLIKDEKLLKKPIEAYSRREYQVVRDKIVMSTMDDMVRTYGKQFKNVDEALAAGYKPIYKKSPLQFFPVETATGAKLAAVKKAKPLGYLKEVDVRFIDNYLFPEMKTIDTLAKASGYDAFTRWFKTWVTAYFPAFHVRNYISGNVQNYSRIGAQALNPKNHNTALAILRGGIKSKPVKIGKYVGTTGELNTVMKENFRGASRYISDIGDYVEEIVGNKFRIKKVGKMRQVGNFIEMNQKAVAMTGALRQGKTIKQAVKIAEEAGFDYTKITQFESKIMRRAVPFYTFARKNAELQLKTFAKHPERIINQAKLANAFSVMFGQKVTEEDVKGLPEWALEGLGFKVKDNKFFTKLGFPLEEFLERVNKPLMSTLSSLNPIIKYPLESKLGYNFFREEKIIDINKVAPATGELLMKAKEKGIMPEWLDNALNIKSYVSEYDGKTKYTMSPKALHVLSNIPTSRFQNTLEKIFDGDLDKTAKWLAFLSGAKIYDINIEEQKYFKDRDLRRDIEDQLLQRGVGDTGEYFYIRKD